MANFPMDDSRFEQEIRKLETSDKAHASVFNDVFQKLVNNEAFLKRDKVSADGGDLSGTQVGEMEDIADEFPVPGTGESSGRLWGKMKKFCEDFNNMKTGILTVGKIVNDAKTNNPELPVSAAVAYELGKEMEAVRGEVGVLNTNFTQLNSDLAVKVVTQPGTNLDSYSTEGKYYFSGAVTPVNIPVGINGWLVVYSNGGAIKQIWYRVGTPNANDYDTYVRTCTNGSWGSWSRYLTNADSQIGNPVLGKCPGNAITDFQVTFPQPFPVSPKVMVCLRSQSKSEKYGMLMPYAADITKTGFTFRVANANTVELEPSGTWYASI